MSEVIGVWPDCFDNFGNSNSNNHLLKTQKTEPTIWSIGSTKLDNIILEKYRLVWWVSPWIHPALYQQFRLLVVLVVLVREKFSCTLPEYCCWDFMTKVHPSSDGCVQKDNAPCQKAHIILSRFVDHNYEFNALKRPPQSQDLNPAEQLWNVVEREIHIIDM